MSSPGRYANLFAELPDDIDSLVEIVQGLFVHSDYLNLYGLNSDDVTTTSRETMSVEHRMQQILNHHNAPISEPREIKNRAVGTCRDYALMLCGILREKSVPARVRCGFATYFTQGRYEDHWICEYWSETDGRWRRADAQLDEPHRERLSIAFNPTNVPDDCYLTASEAWEKVKAQNLSFNLFGHGDDAGVWFMHVNLARDLLSLSGRETSDWDRWREARAFVSVSADEHEAACIGLCEEIEDVERKPARSVNALAPTPYWRAV